MSRDTVQYTDIKLSNIVKSEVTKIITQPIILLSVMGAVIANLLFAILDTSGLVIYVGGIEPTTISGIGVVMFAPIYAFLVLPVYAAASEYQGGQNRMSLVAIPNRNILLQAKTIAVILTVFAGILVAVIPPRLIINIFANKSMDYIIIDIIRWSAVYLLMSIVAWGIAGITRSILVPLSILVLIPIFIATGILQWYSIIRFMPDQASMSLLGTPSNELTKLPPNIALIALTVWAILMLGAYWIAFNKSDS